jgi:monoamine oxidase
MSTAELYVLYRQYLDTECRKTVVRVPDLSSVPPSVGIVGGGMAGLYSALLLQKHIPGVKVKIFEADNRVGGRVYTHKFSSELYQYYDTGAMRVPDTESHKPVFTLIDHLNKEFPNDPITFEEFFNSCPKGNRLHFNNTKQKNGYVMSTDYASNNCSELAFSNIEDHDNATVLLNEALTPVVEELKADFENSIKKYSKYSVYEYLSKELGWNVDKIRYVEAMSGSTNEFRRGLMDEVFFIRMFDNVSSWKTIVGGMSRLPDLCAKVLAMESIDIKLNSKIEAIVQQSDGESVRIGYKDNHSKDLIYESFDAIILAIPSPHIRMMLERPYFGPDTEHALRTTYFKPASAMGLRFNTRFWERPDLQLPPSLGGRSLTDHPIRRVVYPSHGIGDGGKGVLCMYTVGDDTEQTTLLSKGGRIKLALQGLQLLYPEVNIKQEYAGGDEESATFLNEAFFQDWPIGAVFYHPEEFLSHYSKLVSPQGNIYFAGDHLTPNSVWIVGALESARRAVQQLVLGQVGNVEVNYI